MPSREFTRALPSPALGFTLQNRIADATDHSLHWRMATMSRAMGCLVPVLIWVTPVRAQRASAREAIRLQVQGFYRDERDHRWPDVLDHLDRKSTRLNS